ncbi:MAG: family 20 glycosylhydrolase, partial [Armatimonadetes bacterium]|nr:family 20 glycosylhydrolase [Armatimonadota bacterium]
MHPVLALSLSLLATAASAEPGRPTTMPWRGVHLLSGGRGDMPRLKQLITEVMPRLGLNVLVLEVDYAFDYKSHPELADGGAWTADEAHALARLCREHHIRLIPQFQCLGHQSWAKNTGVLLTKHPEFDETPQIPRDNPGIYCRSWCPLHPDINKIVFALCDELIEAFEADALHVGMDEVFLIGSDQCPRCRGKNKAELFAKAVNDLHAHLVGEKRVTMLMWGDRFLDGHATGYGEWEAATNGTAPAIDLVPKDIVICDWHYGYRTSYPSLPIFLDKGFRVWPSGWRETRATLALIDDSLKQANERMMGHLFTAWTGPGDLTKVLLREPGWEEVGSQPREVAEAMEFGAARLRGEPIDPAKLKAAAISGPAKMLLNAAKSPPPGQLLATVATADLAAGLADHPGWTVTPWPADGPNALVMQFPGAQPSAAGSGCRMDFNLPIPAGVKAPSLQLYLNDTLVSPDWPGYRWYALRCGDRLLWEEDLALNR